MWAGRSRPHLVPPAAGSGKTTTLYGAVDHLNRSDRVVVTIDEPVERRLDGVNQVEVDVKAGLSLASGLRTILRSDPDVVLVGEVRDCTSTAGARTRVDAEELAAPHADVPGGCGIRLI